MIQLNAQISWSHAQTEISFIWKQFVLRKVMVKMILQGNPPPKILAL